MDDLLRELLVNLVVSLVSIPIGAVLAFSYRKVRETHRRRAYTKFWQFPGGKAVIVRTVATERSDPDDPDQKVWMSDLFSSMTVEVIWEFLHQDKLASTIEVVGSNKDPQHLDENIVFIGGTLGNPWCSAYCDKVLESIKLPFYWYGQEVDQRGPRALKDAKGVTYRISEKTEDQIVDYGLVLKARNPWTREKRWIYVLAGNLGAGTYGAGKFVTDEPELRYLARRYDKDTPISFVVRCTAKEFSLAEEPEIVTPVKSL